MNGEISSIDIHFSTEHPWISDIPLVDYNFSIPAVPVDFNQMELSEQLQKLNIQNVKELQFYKMFREAHPKLSDDELIASLEISFNLFKTEGRLIVQKDRMEEVQLDNLKKSTKKKSNRKRKYVDFHPVSRRLQPIGPFAPRCQRCMCFPVNRTLIDCFMLATLDSENLQPCMMNLCVSCYCVYRTNQLFITSQLKLQMSTIRGGRARIGTLRYKMLYRDVPNNILPEANIHESSSIDGSHVVLFGKRQYNKLPPRAIRDVQVPKYDISKIVEVENITQAQEKKTREDAVKCIQSRNIINRIDNEVYIEHMTKNHKKQRTIFERKPLGIETLKVLNANCTFARKKLASLKIINTCDNYPFKYYKPRNMVTELSKITDAYWDLLYL
jgi:hypothetical protein